MSDINEKIGRSGIQVIARAAAILRVLKADGSGLSLAQIAEAVDLPRSTVQRIVGALQVEQLVIADKGGSNLRLGPEISALAESARHNIVEICRLHLMELTHQTGETTDLSMMRGSGMVFLDQVPGTHRLRTVSSVGEVFPLTTTANGLACLARLPSEKAQSLIESEWERRDVVGDMASCMGQLERVRDDGLAYDLNQHTPGICAIGFAFEDQAGEIHAISVPVPTTRFDAVRPNVETALRRTAHNIEKMMQISG